MSKIKDETDNLEYCFKCDRPTGCAGRADDSHYNEDGEGPFCWECWCIDENPRLHQQLDELRPYSHETVQGLMKWRDERIKQLENEMQKYIYVATMADCYVGLKPEHKLHASIRQDLLASLQALKGGEK